MDGDEALSDDLINLSIDRRTAQLLRGVLYDLGEHQAAGAPIAPPTREEVEKVGGFLRDLDRKLGGSGRMAWPGRVREFAVDGHSDRQSRSRRTGEAPGAQP